MTEGLLLMTNDGDFAYAMTHPSVEIEKEYVAVVSHPLTRDQLRSFAAGVRIDGETTAPCQITFEYGKNHQSFYRIVIHEGRNRQIRRMFAAFERKVMYLRRERVGNLRLGRLTRGKWRYLSRQEVSAMMEQARCAVPAPASFPKEKLGLIGSFFDALGACIARARAC